MSFENLIFSTIQQDQDKSSTDRTSYHKVFKNLPSTSWKARMIVGLAVSMACRLSWAKSRSHKVYLYRQIFIETSQLIIILLSLLYSIKSVCDRLKKITILFEWLQNLGFELCLWSVIVFFPHHTRACVPGNLLHECGYCQDWLSPVISL